MKYKLFAGLIALAGTFTVGFLAGRSCYKPSYDLIAQIARNTNPDNLTKTVTDAVSPLLR